MRSLREIAHMTRQQLVDQIYKKRSYLCVGLDTDITKIPKHILSEPDPVFAFNKIIIDATREACVSYKINTAFYEALGVKGWEAMEKNGSLYRQRTFQDRRCQAWRYWQYFQPVCKSIF